VRLDACFDDVERVHDDCGDGGCDGGGVEARLKRVLAPISSSGRARGVHDAFATRNPRVPMTSWY
jgi:hypothetical protein